MSGLGVWNYVIIIFLMMIGLYMVMSCSNLVKKLIGLNVFQTSVFFPNLSECSPIHAPSFPIRVTNIFVAVSVILLVVKWSVAKSHPIMI